MKSNLKYPIEMFYLFFDPKVINKLCFLGLYKLIMYFIDKKYLR
jgi:hypothetical protein